MMILAACIVAAFKRPWLGVLGLAFFTYASPHRYAWGFALSFPVYQVLFIAVVAAFVFSGMKRQPLPKDWRIPTFFFLWIYFFLTTLDAAVPQAAWPKLIATSKVYLPFLLTLWLIDSREKLFWLIAVVAGSLGLLAVKGGVFAISTGFSYLTWGPDGTQFAGNNEFALATLIIVPLLILLMREVKDLRAKYALMAAIPLCFASAIASHSRGAFLTLGILVVMLLWHGKRKWLIVPVMFLGGLLLVQTLPEEWFERMRTIETYEVDASAMNRIEAWTDGIRYALANPLTGAGFDGWRMVTLRDWHSAYVEALAEHGFPGFLLWLSLLYGSIFSLTNLGRKVRHVPELAWVRNYSYMLRMSLIAYAVGSLFLGLTYWSLLYHIVFMAVLTRKFALEELASYEADRETGDSFLGGQLPSIREGKNRYGAVAVKRDLRIGSSGG
jgi:probable O-glycosylation ligase (exosortase A-associated)